MNLKTFPFKLILLPFLITVYCLLFTVPCHAARKRVRKPKQSTPYVSQGVRTYIRFRPDRLGLLMDFSHFDNLASGRYELIYESNGITQGAGGSIILGDTGTKEILFGTCSGGVCRWHENITNTRLSVVSTLKNGTKILKPYRILVQ